VATGAGEGAGARAGAGAGTGLVDSFLGGGAGIVACVVCVGEETGFGGSGRGVFVMPGSVAAFVVALTEADSPGAVAGACAACWRR